MKIGIFTFFWSDNPGSFLQAYATYQALKEQFPGSQIEFIDCKHEKWGFKIGRRHLSPLQLYKDIKRYRIYESEKEKYLPVSEENIVTRNYAEAVDFLKRQNYDMIVVGSDTIWRLRPYHYNENTIPPYWLPADLNCKKVACAASTGTMNYEDLSKDQVDLMKRSLDGFDLVSIRDDATEDIIEKLGFTGDQRISRVSDPTFSYDIDYSHVERLVSSRGYDFSQPTIALNVPTEFNCVELVRKLRAKDYRVVLLTPHSYADYAITDISAFQWAGLCRYFDAVITDRFHGTLFSLKNLTPVVPINFKMDRITNSGRSKVRTLFNEFNIDSRYIFDCNQKYDIDCLIELLEDNKNAFPTESVKQTLSNNKKIFGEFIQKTAAL